MSTPDTEAARSARSLELIGKAALIASVGGARGYADWTNPDHRLRRLLAEFIGMAGLTFILSGGAAILARYGGHALQPWQTVLVLSAVSALWLIVAVHFLGDISAHFNPATTLAFALRRDMDWVMAGVYWVVQFAAAACGSLLARGRPYPCGHLPVTAGRYASASQLTVARRAVWADARTWADRKDRLVSHPHLTRNFIQFTR